MRGRCSRKASREVRVNNDRRRYLKWSRRAREAFAAGKKADKFLVLKWKYWHKLYHVKPIWGKVIPMGKPGKK